MGEEFLPFSQQLDHIFPCQTYMLRKSFNSGNTLLCSNLTFTDWSFVFCVVNIGSDLSLTKTKLPFYKDTHLEA